MGAQQSKEELLYQQINYGNIEGIKALRQEGAGLEWVDKEGKTPLILACMRPDLLVVAKVLIELGANVNVYRPGRRAGTPLHHAARGGLEQTVNLLLSHGANPFVMNDDHQTPLDLARSKGHSNVVRAIESRTCLFSGWLREVYRPGILEALDPQWVSRKIWVVVLPCDSSNPTNPRKFNLAIYPDVQAARPQVVIALWKVHIEDPNFNEPDPALVIVDKATTVECQEFSESGFSSKSPYFPWAATPGCLVPAKGTLRASSCGGSATAHTSSLSLEMYKARVNVHHNYTECPCTWFLSAYEGDKQQLQWFYNACTGIIQATASAPASASMANHTYLDIHAPSASTIEPVPSSPAIIETIDDDAIHYPSIDFSPVNSSVSATESESESEMEISENKEGSGSSSGSCVICLDASVEGACIPCGHMAGCMSCLNEIEAKKWGCPVCRANIDQVVRLYAV